MECGDMHVCIDIPTAVSIMEYRVWSVEICMCV